MRDDMRETRAGDPADPLRSLLRISSHLAGQTEIRAALRAVTAEIEEILPLDHLDVCLVDETGTWNTSYEVGLRTRWSQSRSLVAVSPIRDILSGEVDFMLSANAMEDARYLYPGALCQPILSHRLRSRVNVAMKVLGRTVGALNCSSRRIGVYDMESVERLRHVADVLAPYFHALRAAEKARAAAVAEAEARAREEGLREGAAGLMRALERERRRIGMDLHDQTLADLTRLLREVERGEAADLPDRLRLCVEDLRRIIDDAAPTLLDFFGVGHALKVHLERATAGSATEILVHECGGEATDALPADIRIALFRIAQEAINNAARHAGAGRISLTVEETPAAIRIAVEDDGPGFGDLSALKQGGGLSHMAARARLIGARFAAISGGAEEGFGARVSVVLPREGRA